MCLLSQVFRQTIEVVLRGADIVEVAPAYDSGEQIGHPLSERSLDWSLAEITGIAAADFVHDFLSMFLAKEPPKQSSHRKPKIAALIPQNWFL